MLLDDVQRFLAGLPLFQGAPPSVLAAIAERLRPVDLTAGEVLLRQGELGDRLYILFDGRVEAVVDQGGRERVIGSSGRGEIVGELALITGEPRACSLVAVRPTHALALTKDDFLRLLDEHPRALFAVVQQLARRLRTQLAPEAATRTVALVPLGRDVDIDGFADALIRALSPIVAACVIRRSEIDAVDPSRASHDLIERLARAEGQNDLVIYVGEHAPTGWSRLCLGRADLVVLVGDARGNPAPTPLEAELLAQDRPISRAPIDLVLLHDDAARRPQGTARWLDPRRLRLHHHVRRGRAADHQRLARALTGRSIQLVLSGGGGRAFSHIGVVRAFEEAGIPIDFIGGASMGASVAALIAMELPAARVLERMRPFVTGKGSIKDLTLPLLSVFSGGPGTRALEELSDGWCVEDLWTDYFATSVDLRRAEEIVHRRGALWKALRAASGIPGVFPPFMSEGRCLIDAGVVNNLPVDVMARIAEGRIVAIDASREFDAEFDAPLPPVVSGWRLLSRRLRAGAKGPKTPHIGDVLMRASEIAALRLGRETLARTPIALRVAAPLDAFGMLDFERIDEAVEVGYRFAIARADGWKASLGLG